MDCIECGKELLQINPGIDTLHENGEGPEESLVCITYKCTNPRCKYRGKKQEHFYDYSRTEINGMTIDESRIIKAGCEALKKQSSAIIDKNKN